MALNFHPGNTVGQQIEQDGKIWEWDGEKWVISTTPLGGSVDLSYLPTAVNGTVTNTGGSDAIVPARTDTSAGLMLPADATNIDEITTEVEEIKTEVEEIKKEVEELIDALEIDAYTGELVVVGEVEEIKKEVEEIKKELEELIDSLEIDAYTGELVVVGEVEEIKKEVEEIKKEVEEIKKEVEEIKGEVETIVDALEIDAYTGKLVVVGEVEEIKGEIEEIQEDIDALLGAVEIDAYTGELLLSLGELSNVDDNADYAPDGNILMKQGDEWISVAIDFENGTRFKGTIDLTDDTVTDPADLEDLQSGNIYINEGVGDVNDLWDPEIAEGTPVVGGEVVIYDGSDAYAPKWVMIEKNTEFVKISGDTMTGSLTIPTDSSTSESLVITNPRNVSLTGKIVFRNNGTSSPENYELKARRNRLDYMCVKDGMSYATDRTLAFKDDHVLKEGDTMTGRLILPNARVDSVVDSNTSNRNNDPTIEWVTHPTGSPEKYHTLHVEDPDPIDFDVWEDIYPNVPDTAANDTFYHMAAHGQTIIISTGSKSYKSIDEGNTFHPFVPPTTDQQSSANIEFITHDGHYWWIATSWNQNNHFRSVDTITWEPFSIGKGDDTKGIASNGNGTYIVTKQRSIYKSTDDGQSWSTLNISNASDIGNVVYVSNRDRFITTGEYQGKRTIKYITGPSYSSLNTHNNPNDYPGYSEYIPSYVFTDGNSNVVTAGPNNSNEKWAVSTDGGNNWEATNVLDRNSINNPIGVIVGDWYVGMSADPSPVKYTDNPSSNWSSTTTETGLAWSLSTSKNYVIKGGSNHLKRLKVDSIKGYILFNGDKLLTEASLSTPDVDVSVDLSYAATSNDGTIVNSEGDNAVIPAVDETNAGLMTPDMLSRLDALEEDAYMEDVEDAYEPAYVRLDGDEMTGDLEVPNLVVSGYPDDAYSNTPTITLNKGELTADDGGGGGGSGEVLERFNTQKNPNMNGVVDYNTKVYLAYINGYYFHSSTESNGRYPRIYFGTDLDDHENWAKVQRVTELRAIRFDEDEQKYYIMDKGSARVFKTDDLTNYNSFEQSEGPGAYADLSDWAPNGNLLMAYSNTINLYSKTDHRIQLKYTENPEYKPGGLIWVDELNSFVLSRNFSSGTFDFTEFRLYDMDGNLTDTIKPDMEGGQSNAASKCNPIISDGYYYRITTTKDANGTRAMRVKVSDFRDVSKWEVVNIKGLDSAAASAYDLGEYGVVVFTQQNIVWYDSLDKEPKYVEDYVILQENGITSHYDGVSGGQNHGILVDDKFISTNYKTGKSTDFLSYVTIPPAGKQNLYWNTERVALHEDIERMTLIIEDLTARLETLENP